MIWLIGCKGMLGSEVAELLEKNNIEFTGTDRQVDITDLSALEDFVRGKDISYIVNCAAYTAVDLAESNQEAALALNAAGPKNIAIVAKKIGAKVIHISTDYVFDGTSTRPLKEDDPIAPIGVYGSTKAKGEAELAANTDEFYILRTAWLYGKAGKNFVFTMIKLMQSHDSIKVVSDQWGTPTWTNTLANVIISIIQKGNVPYGIYHCTDLGKITWYDFAVEIQKQAVASGLLNKTDCVVNPCTTADYPTPAKRPAYSVLDKTKIQDALGIRLPAWEESLKKFLSNITN